MPGKKKYSVVLFEDESLEIIPTSWLVSENMTRWPPNMPKSHFQKIVQNCEGANTNWKTHPVSVRGSSNSYTNALAKLRKVVNYMTPGEDSADISATSNVRERKKPKRFECYQDTQSTVKECPAKKYTLPPPPHEGSLSNSLHLSTNQIEMSDSEMDDVESSDSSSDPEYRMSTPKHVLHEFALPVSQIESHAPSKVPDTGLDTLALTQIEARHLPRIKRKDSEFGTLHYAKRIKKKTSVGSGMEASSKHEMRVPPNIRLTNDHETCRRCIDQKVINERLLTEILLLHKKLDILINRAPPLGEGDVVVLPSNVDLPLSCIEELDSLNERLKAEERLSSILVKYLHDAGYGKTASCFLQNITKKVLTQELATQFSRCGRKGKKSFLVYTELLNVILAAASKRFEGVSKHTLMEGFGKALANAPEWRGKKKDEDLPDNSGL